MQANVHVVGADAILSKGRILSNQDGDEQMDVSTEAISDKVGESTIESIQDIYECALRHDGGRRFGGTFVPAPVQDDALEEHARRHMKLLSQLALSQPKLLLFLVDLFAVAASLSAKDAFKADCVQRIIRNEVANIVPVLLQSMTAEEVLALLENSDTLAVDLLIDVLGFLFRDDRIPPSLTVIQRVKEISTGLDSHRKRKAVAAIVGGLPAEEVEELLLGFVQELNAGTQSLEEVERVFCKVHRARPPPMSKVALLVFLHRQVLNYSAIIVVSPYSRLDMETFGQKTVLDW